MKRTSYLLLLFMMFLLFVFACEGRPSDNHDDDTNGDIETFTITFDARGGSAVTSIEVDEGMTVTLPVTQKTGHTFLGWYPDDDPSTPPVTNDTPITANLVLYARWQANEYTITFEVNGGTSISSVGRTYDEMLDLPITTKTGHVFAGWYTDENLTQPLTYTRMPDGHLTLYAKWELADLETYQIGYYIFQPVETIVKISLGSEHSAALTSLGRVYTWGMGTYGILGDGYRTSRSIPVEITQHFGLQPEETIVQIELGDRHSAALTSLGRIFTWGDNERGQLGDGTNTFSAEHLTPTEMTGNFDLQDGEKIIQLSVGSYFSSVLTSSGRIFTWGANWYGELGDGTTTNSNTPIDITSGFALHEEETIITITLGSHHSAALTSLGRVFTWGFNGYGQLGDGTANWDGNPSPRDMTSHFALQHEEMIIQLSLGRSHSAALTSLGRVFTWGFNGFGQLGDGTSNTDNNPYPIDITSHFELLENETITQVSLGYDHSSALTSFGRIFTWGRNWHGVLGNGTVNSEDPNPNPIDVTSGFDLTADETISQIIQGTFMTFVLTNESRMFSWGKNNFSQLGDETTTDQALPGERIISYVNMTKFFLVRTDEFVHMSDIVPYMPEKEGYTFSGWYWDITLTTLYEFGTMPDRNIKRYGYWIPDDPSLVVNGDFSQPLEDTWELWFGDGGNSTAVIVDGVLVFDIIDIGANWYSNHFFQTGLTLTQGVTLRLTFDARADIARTIVVKLEDATYYGYIDQNVDITTEWTTYTIDLYMNMPTRTDGKLIFGAGNMSDINEATGVATTIYINNVSLVVIDSED